MFFLKQAPRKDFWGDFRIVVKETDWLGLTLVIAALIQLLMVFQWGGRESRHLDAISLTSCSSRVQLGQLCHHRVTLRFFRHCPGSLRLDLLPWRARLCVSSNLSHSL
jgi:hypothetical protein